VLYCSANHAWKLADFGICSEATSKGERITTSRRGTPAYRAPELLRENATFTNKVDIWNLGCVLFELVQLHPPFTSDWGVQQYDRGTENLKIDISLASKHQIGVVDLIPELFNRDANGRPSGKDCCTRLGDLVIAVACKGLFPPLRGESTDERSLFACPDVQYCRAWAWFPEYVRQSHTSEGRYGTVTKPVSFVQRLFQARTRTQWQPDWDEPELLSFWWAYCRSRLKLEAYAD
jgi:serine/threonine protein kinase